jgi:EpsD family peptidyl-prolyl cis-trans isomerase
MTQRKLLTRSDAEQVGISSLLFPLLLALSSCLVSCGRTESVDDHRAGDPVLATVGGDEITLSAVNAELKTLDGREGDSDVRHQKQVLDALIDRDILARDAARRKIDLDPAVLDAIDREKAKILVKAYMQGVIASMPKPTQQDIDRYYRDHPFLYAERKLFKSDELTIHDVAARQQVIAMSDVGNSMHQILLWLDEHDVPYVLKQRVITGDKLPSGLAEMTSNLVNGKPFIVKDENDFQIWAMTELSLQPLDEDVVRPQIEQTLINQKAREELAADVAKLRAADGVVYSDALRIYSHDTHLAANDGRNARVMQGVQK